MFSTIVLNIKTKERDTQHNDSQHNGSVVDVLSVMFAEFRR
jgi:hypothetical protein